MKSAAFAILIGCDVLGACGTPHDPPPPAVEVPAQWSETGAAGAPPASFDDPMLESLAARALHANLDLRLADSRMREARAHARAAGAALAPSIGAGGTLTGERESRNAPNPVQVGPDGQVDRPGRVESVFQAGFDASWELDLFGRTRRTADAAEADRESAAFDHEAVAISLVAEVARTYVELRLAQQLDQLDRAALAAAWDGARLVKVRADAGMAAGTDALLAQTAAQRTESPLPADAGAIRSGILRLSLLLGEPAADLGKELASAAPIPALSGLADLGVPLDLLRRRPDIRGAERRVAAAAARLDLARIDFYPRISLGGAAGLASTSAGDFFNPASVLWSIGPSISWPIFDGGRIESEIEVKDAQLEQALILYRRAILNGVQDVETALADYRRDKTLLDQAAVLAERQQEAETLLRVRYGGGLDDFRATLAAQGETLAARRDLLKGQAAMALDLVALRKALGGWAGDGK